MLQKIPDINFQKMIPTKKVQFDEIIPHLPQMGKSKFFLLRKFRAVSPNTYLKLHFFPILMLIVQAFGHLHRWIFSISDFWAKSTVLFKWWSVTKSRSTTPWKKKSNSIEKHHGKYQGKSKRGEAQLDICIHVNINLHTQVQFLFFDWLLIFLR